MPENNITKPFNEKLIELLKMDSRFVDDEGELIKAAVIDRAWKIDRDLVKLLLSVPEIEKKFFDEIEGHWIFNINTFIEYISDKNFLANSYTRFRNKIGLNIDGKFLYERGEVSLVWPYKDGVLEGGQTKEKEKRKEIFFNEILAQDEIDRLFDPKVLTNFKRYTSYGEQKVTEIKRDENDTIKENLIIKGNNLLALHTLKTQFRGKVKLIYIDPPYNTGNDSFGYNDNFNHSSWLTFMKNRLEVARELLRDNGSIWINIDDAEAHYLKVLCDEVFGRENFLANVVWQRAYAPVSLNKFFSQNHDYINVYAKKINQFSLNKLERTEKQLKDYKNRDNDPRGPWKLGNPSVGPAIDRNIYEIVTPSGRKLLPPKGRSWLYSNEKYEELLADNRIWFGKDGNSMWGPKLFLNEVSKGITPLTLWLYKEVGHNQDARKEILSLFSDVPEDFSTPKPEHLLQRIIHIGSKERDIILDFFAGSGTTAAVAHKMKRQWITVEQMDYVKDTTVERLKKVIGKRIKREGGTFKSIEHDTGGISKSANWQGGGDFIYCELTKYNEVFMDKIQSAKTSDDLLKIWKDITKNSFLNWYVNPEMPKEAINNFIEIGRFENGLEKQKKLLAELLNKNQLYVNLSEIDDEDFKVNEDDKKLNQSFYGEAYNG
ncbi:MAG: site-specific DNA-methyltransferase [Actinobacteria bacterium]|nr:site-specific DNA-methyltransferase [Actinomycetota bacterium]